MVTWKMFTEINIIEELYWLRYSVPASVCFYFGYGGGRGILLKRRNANILELYVGERM